MSKEFKEFLFEDIVKKDKGFLRGPFGGSLKKEIFVPKGKNTYKVYEQGVVLRKDIEIGDYYINGDYFNQQMYRFEVCPKDFLVSCSGANYGAIFQMPENIEKGIINQALLRIRLNNKIINDKYFDYFFSHHLVNQIIGKKGDSTIPNFPPVSVLKKLNIKIHSSVIEQQKIAKVLSDLDAKIELNNKINTELEAMAKTLYDYWFVQFDFPDVNGKPYKSSGGKMVYNEELKREIPLGWDTGTLSDIAELIRGVSYGKNDIKEELDTNVTPILRATNLTGNVIDLESMVYVPKDLVNPKQYLNKFDILITMSSGSINHIGKNGFFYYNKEVAFGAFCAKLVAKNNFRFYLYSYTQSDFMFNTIKNECLGTNINNLNGSLVNGFKIILPPKDLIDNFNKMVGSYYERIAINHKENQELASLRDWLLPMLMNGQVSVGDVEEELGMVAEPSDVYKRN